MKGDFSRSTFHRHKNFSGVRMQQGRVQLDADWNEQVDIQAHHLRTALSDAGLCGAPDPEHFRVTVVDGVPKVQGGRYYAQGVLCENHDREVPLAAQRDLPGERLPAEAGPYLAYLDVWERHVTALEDPTIREIALNGPDTATRTQVIWQVRLQAVAKKATGYRLREEPSRGRLAARTLPPQEDFLCQVAPAAGYQGPENQLYRVEIHAGIGLGFKWSRDNASLAVALEEVAEVTAGRAGNEKRWVLRVAEAERDKLRPFVPGRFIELIDRERELRGEIGLLAAIDHVEDERVFVREWEGALPPLGPAALGGKIRLWDGYLRELRDGWLDLDQGVQVRFRPESAYRHGDYWLIPARTASADVQWPRARGGEPAQLPPHGPEHRYEPLALLERAADGGWRVLADLRRVFQPLPAWDRGLRPGGWHLGRPDGPRTPLQPGGEVTLAQLTEGLLLPVEPAPTSEPSRAASSLRVEVPWDPRPRLDIPWELSPGYQEVVLAADPALAEKRGPFVHFRPSSEAVGLLRRIFEKGMPAQEQRRPRLQARWVLRCDQIFHQELDRARFLSGKDGTLEVWFWIVP